MAQHFSIRIPWKDNGYSGLVCEKPCYNTSCIRLKNIAENKNDSFEKGLASCSIKGHENEIPCLSEGGCFMSPEEYTKTEIHPYKKNRNNKTHQHFLETTLVYPPFSLPARPFAWTMLERKDDFGNKITIGEMADKNGFDYDADLEPSLSFKTNWVQEAQNQRAIFENFYQDLEFNKSLVIVYAKQVPFIEESKRVVMGIGFITNKLDPPEHNHTEDGDLRSILWETMLSHTIRDDRKNGFMIPYKELEKYAQEHPEFDLSSVAVLSDDEYFDEFSYATEHVSNDAVISVLNKTIKLLRVVKECGIPGNWNDCIKWCKERLKEVWLERGPFPGLGSMLSAVGFKHGNLIAREAKKQIKNISTFENEIYEIFRNPKDIFSKKIAKDVTQTLCDTFLNLDSEKKSLFWLLARINLSEEQAKVLFNKKSGTAYKIELSDKEIIENPYVLYEKTRICKQSFQISVNKIDTAIFPNSIIADENPVPEPSFLDSPDDKRRIRALAVNVLEIQAQNGHTVYPQTKLAEDICNLPFDEDKQCEITSDVLNNLKNFFSEEIVCIDCDDNTIAYQLCRLNKIDEFIRSQITQRLENERFEIKEDWEKIVNNAFDKLLKDGEKIDEKEKAARKEKTAILQELAESSLSVLIGGAGTGKTTLLALLCKSEKVREGEVLLLAPTGKARVRMSKTMNDQGVQHKAQTIAQFLIRNHRYDWNTCQYRMADLPAKDVPATVIIDESSMMTEEMFGAVLDALKPAKRIIFVGDPNQLPPIGAGRPFVDLVRFLNHDLPPFPEPQVKKGFGKLTITRRQADDGTTEREDSELALWFKESEEALDEQIFTKLQNDSLGKYVSFDTWTTPEELEEKIFKNIAKETEMADPDDIEGFDKSLGGILNNGWMNFGMNPSKIEKWQVLSPYKSDVATGTGTINRYIHDKYRSKEAIEKCNYKRQSTPKLLGTDGITYGEKVINTRNQEKDGYLYDKFLIEEEKKKNVLADCLNYVANGEMGIVERIWAKSKGDKFDTHQIRFSSQPFHNYNWYSKVAQEGNCDIELAYALTVHKSQGSEFETVILVLSEPSRMISRELLYTALTRQKNKIVILYNEDAYKLKNYSSVEFSDIARRFTCLFEKPKIVEYKSRFYEEKLIHKTKRGELVRSKSEVIIANMLFDSGVDYEYEKELKLSETEHRSPDFTIFKGGKEIYWEHLGMLGKESYDRDWNAKRHQYEKYGITVANKNLIISRDGRDGSIDCEEIQKQIDELLK